MQVNDLMDLMGAMAKLNRTIDNQQEQLDQQTEIIKKYIEKYGPLEGMRLIPSADQSDGIEKKELDPPSEPVVATP